MLFPIEISVGSWNDAYKMEIEGRPRELPAFKIFDPASVIARQLGPLRRPSHEECPRSGHWLGIAFQANWKINQCHVSCPTRLVVSEGGPSRWNQESVWVGTQCAMAAMKSSEAARQQKQKVTEKKLELNPESRI